MLTIKIQVLILVTKILLKNKKITHSRICTFLEVKFFLIMADETINKILVKSYFARNFISLLTAAWLAYGT